MCIHLCVLVRIPQRAKTPPTGIRYPKWCQCSPCEWCCIPASLFRERNLNGPIREITRKSRYLPTKRSRESLPKFSKRRRWRRAPSQRPQAESRSAVRTSFLPGAPSIPRARSTTQPGSELEETPASTPHAARARVDVHSARSVGRSWQRQAAPARSVRLEATDATRTVERAVRSASAKAHRVNLLQRAPRLGTPLGRAKGLSVARQPPGRLRRRLFRGGP